MLEDAVKQIVERALRETVPDLVRAVLREHRDAQAAESSADEFLTTAEAAALAKVNAATVRKWLDKGHLTRHRAGREIRVKKTELRDFLRCQTSEVESADDVVSKIVKSL